jgi:hypothetical protein
VSQATGQHTTAEAVVWTRGFINTQHTAYSSAMHTMPMTTAAAAPLPLPKHNLPRCPPHATCLQIFFVWWIGVNRFRENRHNISDIVAGWFMVRGHVTTPCCGTWAVQHLSCTRPLGWVC